MSGVSGATTRALGWRAMQLMGVQLIYFVRLLILARLLDPDAFGLVAIAMVAVSVAMRLSDLGMIPALVQRSGASDREYDIAWTAGLLRSIGIAVLLIVAAPLVAPIFGEPGAAAIIQALALRPVIEACASIGVARLTRQLQFRELAWIKVPGAVTDTVAAIAVAPLLGVWALVIGALVGAAVTAILSYYFAPHRPRLDFHLSLAAPLIRYGRWVLLTGIVALAGSSTTQLILSRETGAAGLGLYFLAVKLAFLPIDIASSIVGAVAFPLYATHGRDVHQSAAMFRTLLSGQAILLLPAYGLLIALAPVVPDLLGVRWAGTAPVVQILSLACVLGMFGEALTPVLMGHGRSDRVLVLETVQSVVLLAVLWPLVSRFGLPGAALAWLIGNASSQAAALIYAGQMLPGFANRLGRQIVAAVAAALACALIATAVRSSVTGVVGFTAAAGGGVVSAASVIWLLHRRRNLDVAELLPWSSSWSGAARTGVPR